MAKLIFVKYNDPAHGWLRMSRKLVNELIIGQKISAWSYQSGKYVYLEEDRDMSIAIQALTRQGIKFEIKEKFSHGESIIRRYQKYEYAIVLVECDRCKATISGSSLTSYTGCPNCDYIVFNPIKL